MAAGILYQQRGRWASAPLEGDCVSVGRDPSNDIVVENRAVSRHHAEIRRTAAGWTVADLGSRYGTTVEGRADLGQPLRDGETILLHDVALRFVDPLRPQAALTPKGDEGPAPATVFESVAVDFSALASSPPDIQHLQRLLAIVTGMSQVILASRSLDETFTSALDLVLDHLPVERGAILLWDDEVGDLVARCVRRRSDPLPTDEAIQFSRTIAEKVFRERVAVLTKDAMSDARFSAGESVVAIGIRSAMAAPVWSKDRVHGLIYADTTRHSQAFDGFDLDLLSALGNYLAVTLDQTTLRESVMRAELLRGRLERYHSPAVVDRITAMEDSVDTLVAEERDVTVVFVDLVKFTDRCEQMQPFEVAEFLNHYFGRMTEIVFSHDGTLDKFIGDCLMAVFGAPLPLADHAQRAAAAVLEMREALDELNAARPSEDRVHFRVGLHSGPVVAGDIGSTTRRDYTVLGATVNLAARLESSVAWPDAIVISEATRAQLAGRFETRALGAQQLKGIEGPVECHELVGRTGQE